MIKNPIMEHEEEFEIPAKIQEKEFPKHNLIKSGQNEDKVVDLGHENQNNVKFDPKKIISAGDMKLELKRISKDLLKEDFEDPNQFISKLEQHLETIKMNVKAFNKYLFNCGESKFLDRLKNSIFTTLNRVLTTKPELDDNKLNIKKFEEAFKFILSMDLVTKEQSMTILSEYYNFCDRYGEIIDVHLLEPQNNLVLRNKINEDKVAGLRHENQNNEPKKITTTQEMKIAIRIMTKDLSTANFEDPNQFISKLEQHLETIKRNIKVFEQYLSASYNKSRCVDRFKDSIFTILNRVLLMKPVLYNKLNIKKFEENFKFVFSMDLVTKKQLKAVLSEYYKFCDRYNETINIDLWEEASHKVADITEDKKDQKPVGNKPQPNKIISVLEKNKENIFEEKKLHDKIIRAEMNKVDSIPEVYCIICMKNARGVVLIPCKHFLTCVPCSPKILNCPICSKKVQDHMTIFWS